MDHAAINARRWKRIEYDRLIESAFFRSGDPVELLGGQLIVAEPQGSRHFAAVRAAEEALRAAFGRGSEVRGRGPLALDDESEPEPDLAVVPGSFRDYETAHPSRPVLVVEIGDAGLAFDREHKGSLYARAGLADYWNRESPGARARGDSRPRAGSGGPPRLALPVGHGAGPRGVDRSSRAARPAHRRRKSPALS